MAQSFQTSSVTYVFVDPNDTEGKEVKHTIKDLVETPDEAKLTELGTLLAAVIPYMTLKDILIDKDSVLTADDNPTPPATEQTDAESGAN
ncbi:hypothetical protein [Lacticaseibacillus sharpeae]|uniref:Uncharacterized protein n=1 Tax=Lacticaseibacillus sharpeae JCM 1186 = DSM 20505 TaxID=1291052 RepID=A0A0R1ZIV6_9LACO|nr:hypothetical protein [Lacticaseibacillus sharpeae]KRM54862.1 hypothetical protein FC18_GL001904 [Lacticaseibacillus sharpeae JCM 1186 = DSM 20505]